MILDPWLICRVFYSYVMIRRFVEILYFVYIMLILDITSRRTPRAPVGHCACYTTKKRLHRTMRFCGVTVQGWILAKSSAVYLKYAFHLQGFHWSRAEASRQNLNISIRNLLFLLWWAWVISNTIKKVLLKLLNLGHWTSNKWGTNFGWPTSPNTEHWNQLWYNYFWYQTLYPDVSWVLTTIWEPFSWKKQSWTCQSEVRGFKNKWFIFLKNHLDHASQRGFPKYSTPVRC